MIIEKAADLPPERPLHEFSVWADSPARQNIKLGDEVLLYHNNRQVWVEVYVICGQYNQIQLISGEVINYPEREKPELPTNMQCFINHSDILTFAFKNIHSVKKSKSA